MANLRGSIGPNGYVPPANVTVTWRRPGAPDISKKLNNSVRWTDDTTFRQRYGGGDPETIGRQITAIGSEQLGGRAWLILKELYVQAGLNRVPKEIGQEVWDFAVTECGNRPADWCDYKRFTGKPDPICGENCPKCTGAGGEPIPPGAEVPTPTNIRLEDRTLTWDWQGTPPVTFTLYRSGGEGAPLTLLKTVKKSPIVLEARPPEGALLLFYTTQRKRKAAEVRLQVGKGAEPPPPPPPPPSPLAEILAPHTGSKIWDALSAAQREEIVARVRETLPPSAAVSVPEEVKSFLRLLRGAPGPYSVGPGQANPVERLEAWVLGLEKKS
ncbi:MAG TPA: hypothetical protein VNW71_04435 [Thermoanaerobaculia bacterium]|nr:hypothetical protein [Thermoanaerobaculia bacterium]